MTYDKIQDAVAVQGPSEFRRCLAWLVEHIENGAYEDDDFENHLQSTSSGSPTRNTSRYSTHPARINTSKYARDWIDDTNLEVRVVRDVFYSR